MEQSRDGNPIFGVRVPKTLQDEIRIRAKEEELSVAAWLERHLRPILDAAPMPTLESRVMALEAFQEATGKRLDALEGSGAGIVGSGTERPLRASKGLSQGGNRKPRSGPNKTPAETVTRILELSGQGWTGGQIAKEVGLTQQGVSKILKRERDKAASEGP